MANPVKGEVKLELSDGREFTLVGDIEATIEAESLYGKPAAQLTRDAQAGFVGAIRALFYGMLKRHHPAITPGEVAQMLQDHMDEIGAKLTEAMEAAAPKADESNPEGKKGKNPPAR